MRMETISKIKRTDLELSSFEGSQFIGKKRERVIKRIFISGISSLILLLVISYTLPRTILTINSLLEYSIIVSLVLFLLILLTRYFIILTFAYLYLSDYTFKDSENFSPFVSIIIPVYNEAKIIRKTITSLLNLNYSRYEIIIVNDGSDDNTAEIAKSLIGYWTIFIFIFISTE